MSKQHGVELKLPTPSVPSGGAATVSFNLNLPSHVVNNASIAKPSAIPSRTYNRVFAGWKDSNGDNYGTSYTTNAATTLAAQYETTVYENDRKLPRPELAGYVFDGWWTSATGGSRVTRSTIATNGMTIYAHWEIYGVYYIKSTVYGTVYLGQHSSNTDTRLEGFFADDATNRPVQRWVLHKTSNANNFEVRSFVPIGNSIGTLRNNNGKTEISTTVTTLQVVRNSDNTVTFVSGGKALAVTMPGGVQTLTWETYSSSNIPANQKGHWRLTPLIMHNKVT